MEDETNDYERLADEILRIIMTLVGAVQGGGDDVVQPIGRRGFTDALSELHALHRQLTGLSAAQELYKRREVDRSAAPAATETPPDRTLSTEEDLS